MRQAVCAICFLLLVFRSDGQEYQAWIVDVNAHRPVSNVVVTNVSNGALALSDSSGRFVISARPGQSLQYKHTGYEAHRTRIGDLGTDTIYLVRRIQALSEVTVISEEERFRRDSAERRQIYRKTLKDAGSKPSFEVGGGPTGFGVGVSGLFTETALRLSGRKKAARKFERIMLQDERDRYTAIRYNPVLVSRVTGMSDSLAVAFVQRHPIPYDFVRQASDLEIKMWIREQLEQERP